MIEGLFGRKLGMTQIFEEDGRLVPVTVIEIYPAVVLGVKEFPSGKKNVQIAFVDVKESKLTKPVLGIFKKLEIPPKRYIREVLAKGEELPSVGQEIGIELFEGVAKVDVVGKSKGRGFAGGMKRWGWSGGPATHGSMSHRVIGSLGPGTFPGRVIKGRHLPGHMGNARVTVQSLKIIRIDKDNNVLVVKGSVPGHIKSMVFVRKAKKS